MPTDGSSGQGRAGRAVHGGTDAPFRGYGHGGRGGGDPVGPRGGLPKFGGLPHSGRLSKFRMVETLPHGPFGYLAGFQHFLH